MFSVINIRVGKCWESAVTRYFLVKALYLMTSLQDITLHQHCLVLGGDLSVS